jgi:hypothetical protein
VKPLLPSHYARRAARIVLLLLLLWPLQGCGGNDDDDDEGTTPFVSPFPVAGPTQGNADPSPGNPTCIPIDTEADLETLINNFRVSNGLPPLTRSVDDEDQVAADAAAAWMNQGFPSPIFNFNTVADHNNIGTDTATMGQAIVVRGKCSAQEAFDAMLARDPNFFNGFGSAFDALGIALVDPGAGNIWAVVLLDS